MKLIASLILLSTALSVPSAQAAAAAPVMKVNDLATAFQQVADRNAGAPDAAARDFRETIVPRFPQFYGLQRYGGKLTEAQQDARVAKAFADFPAIRGAYIKKVADFTRDLPRHIASFRAEFPDYPASTDIWFLHSLGEMDGGTRTFDGKRFFVFGADVMVKAHGNGDEAAFFHHELFHDYQALQCGSQDRVWSLLWEEGLATYVALRLNPKASEAELLLDLPIGLVPDTRRQLGRALDDLHAKLDSSAEEALAGLFQRRGDLTGLPARRGYYLGYLVAEEIGKGMSMRQMAKLDCESARKAVADAVEKLRGKVGG
ncbi:hypothetical protein [Massilia sp. 9I]|uniref:hypothetical protein n=1 Tax=Massilia sp. 9I TaxID=2653152 RepID=UPI0012F1F84E|nr:hypothetical protein [Massilia sp. 9I]VXB49813.1 conserved exported hypothetical protein [Massilia sp. 9I]